MRPDEKELVGNVLAMSAVAGFFHTFLEVPLHEYGHYWAASLLGVPMYIDGERAIWASGQMVPPGTRDLIYLSGGLCAGSLLLVVFFLMRKPYRYGLLPLVAANFAYAPLDGTAVGFDVGLTALIAVWICLFGIFLARFLRRAIFAPAPKSRREVLGSLSLGRNRAGARGFEPLS